MKNKDARTPASLQRIEADAMRLDLESRAELVRRLMESLKKAPATSPSASDIETERLWIQEAMKRSRELRTSMAEPRPVRPAPPRKPSARPARKPARKPPRKLVVKKSRPRRKR